MTAPPTKAVMNFNAGPAALPRPALERAERELLDFAGTGISVMEHSHRGREYEAVHREATETLRRLLGLSDEVDVLFLQGGASLEFARVPMCFLPDRGRATYVVNGTWGEKAVAEAKIVASRIGATIDVISTARSGSPKYTRVSRDDEIRIAPGAAYAHFTSNETIDGLEYAIAPAARFPSFDGVPVVCDMSSDFLWRKVDLSPFSLVYAGAQKNVGPSGVTIVLAKKSFVASGRTDVPRILQYQTHAEAGSRYNTPSTFGVYLVRNVLAWIEAEGGLDEMERRNRKKAEILYSVLDEHEEFYRCPVEPASRSRMNVVFRLPTEAQEEALVAEAKRAGMIGIKGHRSVGGLRVSLYNAVEVAWVEALADLLRAFARRA